MPLNRRNVLPPGRSPCRVTSQIRSRCPDLRPDKLNHPRGCRHHIIWHETEQPQRPDLQTANQTSARADTIPHQLKITFAQRETADQILGGYLHRETVQHRTIVITQEAAASHINHPETEPSSHHPQPHQHHSPRHPGHPTSNSTVTSRPFTGRTPRSSRRRDRCPASSRPRRRGLRLRRCRWRLSEETGGAVYTGLGDRSRRARSVHIESSQRP